MKSKGTDTRGSVTHTLIIKSFNVNHNLCNILQYSFKFHQNDSFTVFFFFGRRRLIPSRRNGIFTQIEMNSLLQVQATSYNKDITVDNLYDAHT